MENGEKKISREDLRRSVFLHKGRNHYSVNGYFIECITFHEMRDLKINDKDILKEFGTEYEKLFAEQDRERATEEKKNAVHNIKELIQHIRKLIGEEKYQEIEKKSKNCKTMQEIIELFPDPYYAPLKLYYANEKRHKIDKKKEIESLTKTLVDTMSTEKDYNPNAFIEVDSG